jgi:hypothetical protein
MRILYFGHHLSAIVTPDMFLFLTALSFCIYFKQRWRLISTSCQTNFIKIFLSEWSCMTFILFLYGKSSRVSCSMRHDILWRDNYVEECHRLIRRCVMSIHGLVAHISRGLCRHIYIKNGFYWRSCQYCTQKKNFIYDRIFTFLSSASRKATKTCLFKHFHGSFKQGCVT